MKLSGLLVMFALLIASGCASLPETLSARRVDPGEALALKQDEILIFGRILFTENGMRKAPYGLGKPFWQLMSPETKPAIGGQSGKRKIFPFLSTSKEGGFAYVIPAGRYEMTHVQPFGYIPMIDPAIEFDASEPVRAYYLGDLEVDINASIWLGGLWGNYITRLNHLEVVDRFDEARGQFAGTLPGSDPIRKALLTRIPGRAPQLKEQFIPNNPLARHSGEGRNPVRKKNPQSGQNRDVVPLARESFNPLDSGLRRNDAVLSNGQSRFIPPIIHR